MERQHSKFRARNIDVKAKGFSLQPAHLERRVPWNEYRDAKRLQNMYARKAKRAQNAPLISWPRRRRSQSETSLTSSWSSSRTSTDEPPRQHRAHDLVPLVGQYAHLDPDDDAALRRLLVERSPDDDALQRLLGKASPDDDALQRLLVRDRYRPPDVSQYAQADSDVDSIRRLLLGPCTNAMGVGVSSQADADVDIIRRLVPSSTAQPLRGMAHTQEQRDVDILHRLLN